DGDALARAEDAAGVAQQLDEARGRLVADREVEVAVAVEVAGHQVVRPRARADERRGRDERTGNRGRGEEDRDPPGARGADGQIQPAVTVPVSGDDRLGRRDVERGVLREAAEPVA